MTSTAPVLHGLGDLVAYLPFHWGFELTGSVLVVGSGPEGLGPVSRADVPAAVTERLLLVQDVVDQLRAARPARLEVLLFDTAPGSVGLASVLATRLDREIAPVQHVVQVEAAGPAGRARWSVVRCACGRACPRDVWTPVPEPHQVAALRAELPVLPVPLPGRTELAARVAPAHPRVAEAIRAEPVVPLSPRRYAGSLARVLDLRSQAPAVHRVSPVDLAVVLRAWADTSVRDQLLEWLLPPRSEPAGGRRRPDLDRALADAFADGQLVDVRELVLPGHLRSGQGALARRLSALVACAPEELVAPAAAVLAYACWFTGGGALASIAAERALQADPEYRLAVLLRCLLAAGVQPPPESGARMTR